MAMRKVTIAMTEEMYSDLEEERKARRLSSVAEAGRAIVGEYLRSKEERQTITGEQAIREEIEKRTRGK